MHELVTNVCQLITISLETELTTEKIDLPNQLKSTFETFEKQYFNHFWTYGGIKGAYCDSHYCAPANVLTGVCVFVCQTVSAKNSKTSQQKLEYIKL